jgi:hypothetical protein
MGVRLRLGALLGALVLASPAAAQQWGTVEVGAFGQYTIFDPSLGFDQWIGFGGHFGVFALPRLEIEGDISHTKTSLKLGPGTFLYTPMHARLVYNQPLGQNGALLIGAGYVHNEYRRGFRGKDDGASALIGARAMFSRRFGVRVATTVDYMSSPANHARENWNVGLQGGISLLLFGGMPKQPPVVAQAARLAEPTSAPTPLRPGTGNR